MLQGKIVWNGQRPRATQKLLNKCGIEESPDLDCRLLGPSRSLPGLSEGSTGALSHVAFGRHQGHPGDDAVEGRRLPVGAPPRQALP